MSIVLVLKSTCGQESVELHQWKTLVSILRLELLACVLLSKLIDSVVNAVRLEVRVGNMFCWADSKIAVWWIKQSNKKWNIWVQSRVEIICYNISWVHWSHVPSSQNPADIATRSILLHTTDHSSWQEGPSFLLQGIEHWSPQDLMWPPLPLSLFVVIFGNPLRPCLGYVILDDP